MRDFDTISAAITAAETGHLVMSTLHTTDAPSTIDRIIDVFPPHQQQQIRVQLASVLVGIASQQLIPRADGNGRVAVVVLSVTDSVAALIRDIRFTKSIMPFYLVAAMVCKLVTKNWPDLLIVAL